MRAVGEVIIQHAKVFHFANPVFIGGVKVLAHQYLIDGFINAAKGGCINHVAHGFPDEQSFGGQ